MSCTNETLISFWPRRRIFSQFLQVWKAVTFDSPWSRVGHGLRPIFMLWLVKIWQESSCGKLMHHLGTCLLIAEVDRVLCHVVMFLTGCTQWNTAAFKILLLFMSGLFIEFLVEKCAACQSRWKPDCGWHRVHLAWCVRGLKSLKQFSPYLMVFRSCISTGKPE